MKQEEHTPGLEEVAAAQRSWERAGILTRFRVLADAGRQLAERRPELDQGLFRDGLSQRLAKYYGDWIVHQGTETLLEQYARDLVRWRSSGAKPGELLVRRPDGVVLLITPANSPTITSAVVFSLLLPGNGLVVRAPPNDRGLRFVVDEVLGGALDRGGFGRDLIKVVTGKSRAIIDEYFPREEIRTIVFFGNSVAGSSVAERGHQLGKKVVLELDGSDHMVVWKDADLDGALPSAEHAFDFSTQPCPIPKHFLVHEQVYPEFVRRLRARLPKLGVTAEADPIEGNLVPVARPEGFFAALSEVKRLGRVCDGGYRMDAHGRKDSNGAYVAPTLVELEDSVVEAHPLRCFDDEIFFPLIPVVRYSGTDEDILGRMCRLIAKSPFGLRCSVWSEDAEVLGYFGREVGSVGLLLFNDDHAQCPQYASPWGGPKRSGGPHGESHLFWEKTSHLQAIGCDRLAPQQFRAIVESIGYTGFVPRLDQVTGPEDPREWTETETLEPEGFDRSVACVQRGRVGMVVLNRPEFHNAISPESKDLLLEATDLLEKKADELQAVLIRGEGPSFCSGGDLRALRDFGVGEARRFMFEAAWAFRRFAALPVPVIAQVHGYCLGGGLELALHCDQIIASESSQFGFPETGIGLVTTAGVVDRLCRSVGESRARELLLSGRRLSAVEAERIGLVTRVVPASELQAAVDDALRDILQKPRDAVVRMKELLARKNSEVDSASWVAELDAFEGLFPSAMKRQRTRR